MLQYRLIHDTDEFAEGNCERLVLYIIHNDITYEHHVSDRYDTSRVIQHLQDFTIEYANVYINASYYSMTFRLMPIGENIQLIISLRNKIVELEKQILAMPKSIPIQKPPEYLPPNLTLLNEIQYLPWDTLEDLFYMYPLREIFPEFISTVPFRHIYTPTEKYIHKMFELEPYEFEIDINTFDPNDVNLNEYIEANVSDNFSQLARSCDKPYVQDKKINIHVLNWINQIFLYYICKGLYNKGIDQRNPIGRCVSKRVGLQMFEIYFVSANIFINSNTCKIQILKQLVPNCLSVVKLLNDTYTSFKYRMNFYIDDWTAPPVVVYV
jgi:hypothetical protein